MKMQIIPPALALSVEEDQWLFQALAQIDQLLQSGAISEVERIQLINDALQDAADQKTSANVRQAKTNTGLMNLCATAERSTS
jgi:hypothetical protein